jgi:hypothetical protein
MNNTPQAPYFGSFDSSAHYLRHLFKPEYAVQARELNDMQVQMQHQIGTFADHIFKNGSLVSNGRSSITRASYIRCQDFTPTATPVNFANVREGDVVAGDASGVRGTVVAATEKDTIDPATLFVQYNKTGIDGVQSVMVPGEPLTVTRDGVVIARASVRCPSCPDAIAGEIYPTGKSLFFFIDTGVFYYNSYFVDCERQQMLLSKYPLPDQDIGTVGLTTRGGMKIGLDYVETYVTAAQDGTLFDNALGYPNEASEGADRLKVSLVLTVRGYKDEDGKSFILLAKIDAEGRTEFLKSDAEYSAIMDAIAKRTFETNGNYTVRPFGVSFYNHRRTSLSDARGWFNDGDPSLLVALVTPSIGYVRGYRTETLFETPVVFRKARDTKRVTGAVLPFEERAYVLMQPGSVVWPNPIAESGLASTTRILLWTALSGTGTQIGSMLVYNISLNDGVAGSGTATYRYYFSDLTLAPGRSMNEVLSATVSTTGFNAVPVITNGRFEIKNPLNTSLIFKLPFSNVKTLKSTNQASPGSMILTVRKKFRGTANASGQLIFTASTNQSFATVSQSTVGVSTTPANVSTPFPVTPQSVVATSQTVTVNGTASRAGHTITLFLDVLLTNQTQNVKTLEETAFVTAGPPPAAVGSVVPLGVVDVFEIKSVKIFDHTGAMPVFIEDVSTDWRLVTGVTDYGYTESTIVKKTAAPTAAPTAQRLHIEYKSFAHSGNTGFYTADSYASMLAEDGNGVAALTYESLPAFTDKNGVAYSLASSIDFRPSLMDGATTDPVIPSSGSTAIYEAEFYLPRTDLLQLRKDGTLVVKQGLASETPLPPKADDDAMALYQIWLKPYTYSLDDVATKFIENKRYTMRDIGRIEDRIGRIEYYTVLSLLEQRTANLSTKDVNGFDRFKNGMMVDDFSGFQASDLNHAEFRAAVDPVRHELRPSFKTRSVKLAVDKVLTTGVKWLGSFGIREYETELAISQPYATKHISVNPYFQIAIKGQLVLSPNIDVWSDDTVLPAITTEIDAGVDALNSVASAAGVLGTRWGSWAMQNQTVVAVDSSFSTTNSSSSSLTSQRNANSVDTVRTTANTSSTIQTTATSVQTDFSRSGVDVSIGSRTQTYSTGEMARDVSIIPYIRPARVQFFASKLKPSTRVYAFFDNEPVSQHCRNIDVPATTANREFVGLGSPMYTDLNGDLNGEFAIPGATFFTGQKSFRLTTDANFASNSSGVADPDAEFAYAETLYFAGGLNVTKQASTLNIVTPTFNSVQVSEGRSTTEQSFSSQVVESTTTFSSDVVASDPIPQVVVSEPAPRPPGDPVAQSFALPADRFITGIDLYFQTVDKVNDKIFVEIRTMVNGYPSTAVLSRKDYLTSQIPVSDNAADEFHVEFDFPIFCQGQVEYCVVIGGWTPDTRIWVARMGGTDVTLPGKVVETQPTLGSSFRSQNGSTWNAEQFEDIKFTLYTARFTSDTTSFKFNNEAVSADPLESNPIETQLSSARIRVFHTAHGFTEGDKVKLDLVRYPVIEVEVTGPTPPSPGQDFFTTTGSAVIKTVKPLTLSNRYEITLQEATGRFNAAQAWNTSNTVAWSDNFLLGAIGSGRRIAPVLGGTYGLVINNSHTTFVSQALHGIPVEALQKEHVVSLVDGADTYIINVSTPANASGRAGGLECCVRDPAVRFEVINVSGAAMANNSSESWHMVTTGHGVADSLFSADNYLQMTPLAFSLGSDIHMSQPMKIANANGESVNGSKSLGITGVFTGFPSSYVSPVINADTFSAVVVTSKVDASSALSMDVVPNAANRFVSEEDTVGGTAFYKYVSVVARLTNPASDIRVLVDAYRDVHAEFDIYIKTLGESDPESIDKKPWMKMVLTNNPASADLTDFKEHDLLASTAVAAWPAEPFVAFKVKIVGTTRNSCKPPLFRALRTIALT